MEFLRTFSLDNFAYTYDVVVTGAEEEKCDSLVRIFFFKFSFLYVHLLWNFSLFLLSVVLELDTYSKA